MKIKWGGSELAEAMEDYEPDERNDYTGPRPTGGIYKFKINGMQKGESSKGNPQLKVYLELVPYLPEHKKYEGFRMIDFIPIMASTVFRYRPLLDALGVTSKQFLTATIADEEGNISKIGPLKVADKEVLAKIAPHTQDEYFDVKAYLAVPDGADDDTDDGSDDSDDDGTDAPF